MTMTTSTTKTKKTTIKRKTESKKVKLDTNCFQHEILELVSKQRTKLKKIEILQEYRNDALVSLFIWNFDDTVISMLPPGDVPYGNVKDMNSMSGSLNDKISMEANNVHTKTVAYNGTEKPMNVGRTSLRTEYKILYNFVKGGNDSLSSIRRETMFINMLEGLHPLEAELICLVKDKNLISKYNIDHSIVQESYPDIKWGGRS